MDDESILENLERLLADLSIEVRYEKGEFVGGLYRYKDKKQLLINKALTTEQRVNIIANELKSNIDLEKVYVIPALREVIENASSMG